MNGSIPKSERYALSVKDASEYFGIGENKLRRIINDNKEADFVLWNGSKALIKRKVFEGYLNKENAI